jgi:hypothetical protein
LRADGLGMSIPQNVLLGFRSVIKPAKRLLTFPSAPEEGHLQAKLCALLGYPCTNKPQMRFDFSWYFHDTTVADGILPPTVDPAKTINARCLDISKKYVTRAFEEVFDDWLAIDPTTYRGAAVRKSNWNALHDGETIECPIAPSEVREDCVYQRLVDNEAGDGLVAELRVVVMQRGIPLVYNKYRPVAARYGIPNTRVELCAPENVFSANERARIGEFTERIGMDFGELDILRDRNTHRLYIIDANNTPMGPPKGLTREEVATTFRLLLKPFQRLLASKA